MLNYRLLFSILLSITAIFLSYFLIDYYSKPVLKVKFLNDFPRPDKRSLPSIIDDIVKEKYRVVSSDNDYDLVFDDPYDKDDINNNNIDQSALKFFYTPEAVKPDLNKYDLSIGFDYINHPNYIRLPYYYFVKKFQKRLHTQYDREKDLGKCNPNKEHFACFLVSNNTPHDGVLARNSIFHKLSKYKHVLSGGRLFNNTRHPLTSKEAREILPTCKFVIAYENQTHDGYITEKLFQAYYAGAVPIYYASDTAVSDINKKAIINAKDFYDEDALVEYIKKVDNDSNMYCEIWNNNIINKEEKSYIFVKEKLRQKIHSVLNSKLRKS